jgi:DNA-binding response OmpR family regulator
MRVCIRSVVLQFHQINQEKIMTKILIVDDDAQVTVLLGKLLSMEGYQTTAVNDSSKAHEIAISFKPDLILLDLMMPDPDGFKLCRNLRSDPHFMFTPIIIITALDDNDSRVVAFGAGANDYITKPFHSSELVKRIQELTL